MPSFKRVLVGLDFSRTDAQVLQYLKGLTLLTSPDKIIFTNIHKEIEIPQEVLQQFPDLKTSINGTFVQELVEETNAVNFIGCEKEYLALEGNLLEKLLDKSTKEDIDLVAVGRKNRSGLKGLEHRMIIRKAPCNVLIVPESAQVKFTTILIATDFSEYSKLALEQAISLAKNSKAKLICQHIYEVPTGYSKTGKTFTQFAAIMRENAEKNYELFIKNIDTEGVTIETVFTLSNRHEEAENIAAIAREKKVDLVVLGSKGRTNLSVVLMGSVAELLLDELFHIPILIMKKKGAKFGVLEAIQMA